MAVTKIQMTFEGTVTQWKAIHDDLTDSGVTGGMRREIRRQARDVLMDLKHIRQTRRPAVEDSAAELSEIDADIAAIDAALPDFPDS